MRKNIGAVFTLQIVQFLYFLNKHVQFSSLLLRTYRPVCVTPSLIRKLKLHTYSGDIPCRLNTLKRILTLSCFSPTNL